MTNPPRTRKKVIIMFKLIIAPILLIASSVLIAILIILGFWEIMADIESSKSVVVIWRGVPLPLQLFGLLGLSFYLLALVASLSKSVFPDILMALKGQGPFMKELVRQKEIKKLWYKAWYKTFTTQESDDAIRALGRMGEEVHPFLMDILQKPNHLYYALTTSHDIAKEVLSENTNAEVHSFLENLKDVDSVRRQRLCPAGIPVHVIRRIKVRTPTSFPV
jgi:hypothetical protein